MKMRFRYIRQEARDEYLNVYKIWEREIMPLQSSSEKECFFLIYKPNLIPQGASL